MKSIWREHIPLPQGQLLTRDIHTDVAVIGGGMAGILTAKLLREKGVEAVVVELSLIHISSHPLSQKI